MSENEKEAIKLQKQEADFKLMKEALADAITTWASLEDALAMLLTTLIDREMTFGIAIYFTPAAAETRFQIVDVALQSFARFKYPGGTFKQNWAKILLKVNKFRKTRNSLAHGAIIRYNTNRVKTVRLTGPFFQESLKPSNEQLPGMSLNDVMAAQSNFQHCISGVSIMIELTNMLLSPHYQPAPYFEKLQLLEDHLKTSGPQISALNQEAL